MKIHAGSVFAVIVLTLAVFIAGRSAGQDKTAPTPPPTKVKGALPSGWKKLDLSAKQKADAYDITSKARMEIKALEMKISEIKVKERQDLMKLLTDGQKAQLAKSLGIETPTPAPKVDPSEKK